MHISSLGCVMVNSFTMQSELHSGLRRIDAPSLGRGARAFFEADPGVRCGFPARGLQWLSRAENGIAKTKHLCKTLVNGM